MRDFPVRQTQTDSPIEHIVTSSGLFHRFQVGSRKEVDGSVLPIVQDVLRSHGQPLDPATRSFMEPRFGHDFSRVRVHTGEQAAEAARSVDADAYTIGRDVVFDTGQYKPNTGEGRRLVAHELAHVVQQSGSAPSVGSSLRISPVESNLEAGANTASQTAVSGQSVPASSLGRVGNVLSRQARRSRTPPTHLPQTPGPGANDFTIVLQDLGFVRPARAVIETVREAFDPLARQAGRTLVIRRSPPGDVDLVFDTGGHETRPCGLLILGNEGGGDIFVGAHEDLRVCSGPQGDPSSPNGLDYTSQIVRVFDEEEPIFGRFVGNTAVHELAHIMAQVAHTGDRSNFMFSVGSTGGNLPRGLRTRETMRQHWAGRKTFDQSQAQALITSIRNRQFTGGMRIQPVP